MFIKKLENKTEQKKNLKKIFCIVSVFCKVISKKVIDILFEN